MQTTSGILVESLLMSFEAYLAARVTPINPQCIRSVSMLHRHHGQPIYCSFHQTRGALGFPIKGNGGQGILASNAKQTGMEKFITVEQLEMMLKWCDM